MKFCWNRWGRPAGLLRLLVLLGVVLRCGGADPTHPRKLQGQGSDRDKNTLVFIIGARRSGTESLADFLFQHHDICPLPEEVASHDIDTGKRHAVLQSTEWFVDLMEQHKESACAGKKASVSAADTVFMQNVPNMMVTARWDKEGQVEKLKAAHNVKFVVLLREPVRRDLSWFNYQKAKGHFFSRGISADSSHSDVAQHSLLLAKLKAADPLDRHILQHGYYAAQLKEWVKAWGKESTLVLNHAALTSSTNATADALTSFLGLKPGSLSHAKLGAMKAAEPTALKAEEMERQACLSLAEAYKQHNQDLYSLLAEPGWPAAQPKFAPFTDPCVGTKNSSTPSKFEPKRGVDRTGSGKTQKEKAEKRKLEQRVKSFGDSQEDEWTASEMAAYVRKHGAPPPMKTQEGALSMTWPTVFVIAAPKSASSSLADMLFKHPRFCHPKAPDGHRVPWQHEKEVHFFAKRSLLRKGWKFYLKHFGRDPTCAAQEAAEGWYHVDGTPSYMMSRSARQEMPNVIPKALHAQLKFIAVLREPVARDLSWYNHQKAVNMSPKVRYIDSYTPYAESALRPFEDGSAAKMEMMRAPDLGGDEEEEEEHGGMRRLMGSEGSWVSRKLLSGAQRRLLAMHKDSWDDRWDFQRALADSESGGNTTAEMEWAAQAWEQEEDGEEGGWWNGTDVVREWAAGGEGASRALLQEKPRGGAIGRVGSHTWGKSSGTSRPRPPVMGRAAPPSKARGPSSAPPRGSPSAPPSAPRMPGSFRPPPGRGGQPTEGRGRPPMQGMGGRGGPPMGMKERMMGRGKGMDMTLFQGFYDRHLEDWWKVWPKSQTIVFQYDTLMANTSDTMRRIADFIGVDPGPWLTAELPHTNEKAYKNKVSLRDVDPDICRRLRKVFSPHNEKLYKLLEETPGQPPQQPPFPHFKDPCKR